MLEHALHAQGVTISLPNGGEILRDSSLSVAWGEVVALVGPSGSGKSTLARMLYDNDGLRRQGFTTDWKKLEFDDSTLGLVPQNGATFDHLDVRGNLALALSAAGDANANANIEYWLSAVGLPQEWAKRGRDVTTLSGGQNQRLAIGRALASSRPFLFLDEPSVGLDPKAVSGLSSLLRKTISGEKRAALVVTHDAEFAASVADRIILLDAANCQMRQLQVANADELRGAMQLVKTPQRLGHGKKKSRVRLGALFQPFTTLGMVFGSLLTSLRTKKKLSVFWKVAQQSILRPAFFYALVSALIGYTVLFVMSKVGGAGVRIEAVLEQVAGSYAIALAPPLSAMLFAATSAGATSAWLGGIMLTKQDVALRAIGVDLNGYLRVPAWLTLSFGYLISSTIFLFGLIAGGWVLCWQYNIEQPLSLLTSDLLDPHPSRSHNLRRMVLLIVLYSGGLASSAIAWGLSLKSTADSVTRAMTSNVVYSTIWVVMLELLTAMVLLPL